MLTVQSKEVFMEDLRKFSPLGSSENGDQGSGVNWVRGL